MPDESEDEDEGKDFFDMSKIPGVVRHATDRFNIT